MSQETGFPLAGLEPRLRTLLPSDLYAIAWLDQSPETLQRVFEHLRTLQRILHNYVPPQLAASLPSPGRVRYGWEEGALMFTDLSGFTPLMEANAARGQEGATALLGVLNAYFGEMIELIGKAGGELLEFTGDALLVQFPASKRRSGVAQAVRAGLRMQRAMERYASIETEIGTYSLGQRVGIHAGRFLTADIGTPRRMEHVLLGKDVQESKRAEGAGRTGRVCLTQAAYELVKDEFRFEPGGPGYQLVVDDLSDDELGTFDISLPRHRASSGVLLDRSTEGLVREIEEMVTLSEPLAAFIPDPVLNLLVESAAQREIPPDFPLPTIMFVNLIGPPESVDIATPEEVAAIVSNYSKTFALINAAVEARGGLLKKVTYHKSGSDMMIMFGVPTARTDDPTRAADAALAIRNIVLNAEPLMVGGSEVTTECQIGMAHGPVFAAEIGELRGRREFNTLGDTVNTAARLMGRALGNRIVITEALHEAIRDRFTCKSLGSMPLKGKTGRRKVFSLEEQLK